MMYTNTYDSLKAHQVPSWFEDAKIGIMVHWGLYSVPGFAPVGNGSTHDMARDVKKLAHYNPYSEWYMNTMRLKGSPTAQFHASNYGKKTTYYEAFKERFIKESEQADVSEWAAMFANWGMKYCVLTTKHHDGFCLWPSKEKHPSGFLDMHTKRDFVGELTRAVRDNHMQMGLYYSGVFDWSVLHKPIDSLFSFLCNMAHDRRYIQYADAQVRELIARYEPSVLWNDIGYPYGSDVLALQADYLNAVPEATLNDRWGQIPIPGNRFVFRALYPIYKAKINAAIKQEVKGTPELGAPYIYDFTTPEYTAYNEIKPNKWESVRGIGHSFAYNKQEDENYILSYAELLQSLVDVVSKNGNLLIGVGPRADGSIPENQQKPLEALGEWLHTNGEAIYGTRPWIKARETTATGQEVRFTQKTGVVYVHIMGELSPGKLVIDSIGTGREVCWLNGAALTYSFYNQQLELEIVEARTEPVSVLKVILY